MYFHTSRRAYLIYGGLSGKPRTRSLRRRGSGSAVRCSCPPSSSDLRLRAVTEKRVCQAEFRVELFASLTHSG